MKIFESIRINRLEVKSRVAMAPLCTKYADYSGSVSDRLIDFYRERARGEVGLIITGFSSIDNEASKVTGGQIGIFNDGFLPGLNRLAEAVKEYGTKIFVQLCHGGRQSHSEVIGRRPVAPSAIASTGKEVPEELSIDAISRIVNSFALAAARAKRAGFDGVEIHGAHGYLVNQFISAYTNRRRDAYGGDFLSRMRFPKEVIAKVRDKVGDDFPIGFRISGDEHIGSFDPESERLGIDNETAARIAQVLQEAGIDYIHVSAGIRETYEFMTPSAYIPPGNNVPLAEEIKKRVSIPVMVAGGINHLELANDIVSKGKADMVAMARGLIADPHFVKKAKEGRYEEIRRCIRCNECVGRAHNGKSIKCTVNPDVGHENKVAPISIQKKKRFCVVGAGPAGMQAAIGLDRKGHDVVLFERDETLGGKLIPASVPSFKSDLEEFRKYLVGELTRSRVEIHAGYQVTPEAIFKAGPDALIVATGSLPVVPEVPGIERKNVITAEEALLHPHKIDGDRVIVVGGGKVGCETALFLSMSGREVTIVEMCDEILIDEDIRENRVSLFTLLGQHNIKVITNFKLVEVTSESVVIQDAVSSREMPMDYLILACGYRIDDALYHSLQATAAYPIHKIGDFNGGKKIYDAIHQASSLVSLLAG